MESVNFNSSTRKPLVLICPLDWGLGHTTRCIPLIHYLLGFGCRVLIGCNSTQKELLGKEFGTSVAYTPLKGYDIRYGKSKLHTIARIMLQARKILIRIKEENRWLDAVLAQHPVDLVISDNRFGLYSRKVPSIFITHQLLIKTGLGALADQILQRWNYRLIRRFTACWVPDEAGTRSLAGELAHPRRKPPIPVQYLGPLTRLESCQTEAGSGLLIILSGPEPQRSIFEMQLLDQLVDHRGEVVLVRGLPLATTLPAAPAHCRVLNHAPSAELQQLICAAGIVISRCGYTSVMDLLVLQKKTILVPTPGQAEQEFLATHLHQQGWVLSTPQQQFNLSSLLEKAARFNYQFPVLNKEQFKPVVAAQIASLPKPRPLP